MAASLTAAEDGSMSYSLCLPVKGNGDFLYRYGRFGDPNTTQVPISSGPGSSNLWETGVPTGSYYFFSAESQWSLSCFRAMMVTGTDSRKGQPMAPSLYDLSVPTFLQTVTAVAGFLDC